MPYKTIKRPYKTTLGHIRHAKLNEATHGDGLEKQQQDHMRPYKAIQGQARPSKAIQGHTRQTQKFNTGICHMILCALYDLHFDL